MENWTGIHVAPKTYIIQCKACEIASDDSPLGSNLETPKKFLTTGREGRSPSEQFLLHKAGDRAQRTWQTQSTGRLHRKQIMRPRTGNYFMT